MPKLVTADLSNNAEPCVLRYTTIDHKMLDIHGGFDADIVSHTYDNNKGEVVFNKHITEIESATFYNCFTLTSITIPKSITLIGREAFSYCDNLKDVYISDLSAWCKISFYGSNANPLCNRANLHIKGEIVSRLTIPSDITHIGEHTFYNCKSLISVVIPNSVTSIGYAAFRGCSSLIDITIPDSIIKIGKHSFDECINLTNITIPNSIISIGEYAFFGCRNLTSVYISDLSIWCKIDFGRCNNLCHNAELYLNNNIIAHLYIPLGVTEIKDSAFCGCSSLTSITIPNSTTSIGMDAFWGCSNLVNVTISNGITEIMSRAFYECSNLKTIICKATIPPKLGKYAFENIPKDATIIIPEGCEEAYMNSDWRYLFEK